MNTVETLFLKLVTKISGFSGKFATFGGHTLNGFDVIHLFSAGSWGGGGRGVSRAFPVWIGLSSVKACLKHNSSEYMRAPKKNAT